MKKSLFAFILTFAVIISAFSLNAFAVEMQDGTYEVNIALWHSEDDKESMASDAIDTKATIVVENGTKTMHITSGEMSMMGIKASLQELKIADASGNYTDAKVESRNSEGNPTGFCFTMPHDNEYITVKVNPHLAIMGNKDIGARIKVDYSTLKLVKPADAVTQAETETADSVTSDINGKTVTEAASTAEITAVDIPENTAAEKRSEAAPEEASAPAQTDSAAQNNATIIIIAAIAAVIIIFAVVKIKRKK